MYWKGDGWVGMSMVLGNSMPPSDSVPGVSASLTPGINLGWALCHKRDKIVAGFLRAPHIHTAVILTHGGGSHGRWYRGTAVGFSSGTIGEWACSGGEVESESAGIGGDFGGTR